jgi:hypothetical protein
MEYQPLSAERNEIRLLHLITDPDYATSAVVQGKEPEKMIRLRTSESRKFMEAKGTSTYKKHLWVEKECSEAVIPTWGTSEEKAIGLQQIFDTAVAATEKLDWGDGPGGIITFSHTCGAIQTPNPYAYGTILS